jgi:hypothetical protein
MSNELMLKHIKLIFENLPEGSTICISHSGGPSYPGTISDVLSGVQTRRYGQDPEPKVSWRDNQVSIHCLWQSSVFSVWAGPDCKCDKELFSVEKNAND